MPKFTLPIPESYESVSRPVAWEILRQVMSQTGLPKDTPIDYLGIGNLPMPQSGSTIEDKNEGVGGVRFPSSTKFRVEVNEQFYEDGPLLQARLRPEHQLVFTDQALDVYVKPHYQLTQVTLNVQGRFVDKNSAIRWRDSLRSRITAGKMEQMHEVHYHYPLPVEMVAILKEIYDLREARKGYGEDLGTWMRSCLCDRYEVVTTQAGTHPTIVIQEHQIGLVGWFDFGQEPPDPEKDGDGNAWILSFDYNVVYEKPVGCAMLYPMLIHNQFIGNDFVEKRRPYMINKRPQFKSMTRSLLSKFEDGYTKELEAYKGLAIPFWDDWLPERTPPSQVCLLRILLTVDPADTTALLSMQQLGYHEFDPDALAYMLDYPEGLINSRESVFQVHLYKRYRSQDQSQLSITSDLTLSYPHGLSERDYYHIWVGLSFDVETLSPGAKERLRRHGNFAYKLFTLLQPNLEQRGLMPPIKSDGSMSSKEFDDALYDISKRRFLEGQPSVEYQNRLAGHFVVEAKEK